MKEKIHCSQIGYYGRPADTLSREELLDLVSEMYSDGRDPALKASPTADNEPQTAN